jgi:GNAT superfamily N-acetyltransferase
VRYVVRPARPDELPELAEGFYEGYLDNLLNIPMPRSEAETLADLALRQVILKAADYPELIVNVTEDAEKGVIAAGLAIQPVRALSSAHGLYMWVRGEYRGRALFTRAMFRQTEEQLRAMGIARVEFGVMMSNPRALKVYERVGYRTYAVSMVKRLDS